MSDKLHYKHNHYVPEWYQRRFMLEGQSKYHYLDLKPETGSSNGRTWTRRNFLHWGPKSCFAENDLYTTSWGGVSNREIERFFFGKIDGEGKPAVEHFSDLTFRSVSHEAFRNLMRYMSVQKLRTPKGLGFLRHFARNTDQNLSLLLLQKVQDIYCAIWTECTWQIADATHSPTKFIISDHPVVAYNRDCFPGSHQCSGFQDPDIRYVATHTFFPLSLNKVLILTNLSWVRDPYQKPLAVRPNPEFFRTAIFSFQDIQFDRFLTEEEVLEINYVTKRRAFRYLAAAKKDWLHPENNLKSTHWGKLGDGHLLMPDPRHIHGGGEVVIGYKDGASDAYSAYGHRPWQRGYQDEARDEREWESLQRFKAEWSALFGPKYRGLSRHFSRDWSHPETEASEDSHRHALEEDKLFARKPGERQRRRKLMRKQR